MTVSVVIHAVIAAMVVVCVRNAIAEGSADDRAANAVRDQRACGGADQGAFGPAVISERTRGRQGQRKRESGHSNLVLHEGLPRWSPAVLRSQWPLQVDQNR